MRAWPRVCVILRYSLKVVKNLWEAMSVECTACIYDGSVFFYVFLKYKRGMPAVSSMTTPLRVHNYASNLIYSVVILVLAINPFKN